MRLLDGVRFADSLAELNEAERRQVPRIVADVKRDYLDRAPEGYLDSDDNRQKAEAWAQACAERQAVDGINTQRYMRVKGIEGLTRFQESGRLAEALLTRQLPKPPWDEG